MKLLITATTTFAITIAAASLLLGSSVIVSAQEKDDIPTTAINSGLFTTLVAGLSAADLVSTVSEPNGPYTVFAPTDAAFNRLPTGLLNCLLEPENVEALSAILTYHVVDRQVLSTDLPEGTVSVPTLSQGEEVDIDLSSSSSISSVIKLNDSATVVNPDILTTNGVIHVINQVLVPPSIDVAAFMSEICGIITETSSPLLVDIPNKAIDAGIFNTLVAALSAADLVDAVSAPNGPYTVFAPTDDAFAALPEELVPCLLQSNNKDALTNILLYHVVDGQILSTDLSNGLEVPTLLEGEFDLTVDLTEGVKINDSTVIKADVLATNGVIHVINAVLVPPSIDVTAFLETCNSDMDTMDESSSSSTSSYVSSFSGVTTIISIITTGAIVSILL